MLIGFIGFLLGCTECLFLCLDANAWVAIGTFLLVGATLGLWVAAWRTFREQNRPIVFATFEVRNRRLYLSLRNAGNRPATSVEVVFNPALSIIAVEEELRYPSFYKHLLHTELLVPGEHREGLIGLTDQINRNLPAGQDFGVKVSYMDLSSKKSYSQEYKLHTTDFVTAGSNPNIDHFASVAERLDDNFDKILDALTPRDEE